jgi:hypothetical protein
MQSDMARVFREHGTLVVERCVVGGPRSLPAVSVHTSAALGRLERHIAGPQKLGATVDLQDIFFRFTLGPRTQSAPTRAVLRRARADWPRGHAADSICELAFGLKLDTVSIAPSYTDVRGASCRAARAPPPCDPTRVCHRRTHARA